MRRAGWVLALLLLVACSSKAESLWVLTIKSQHLRVELADYPENQGMLFVFQKKQPLSFWMRNTKIPLDIAFLADDGTIFQIEPMQPLDEGHHVSREPARFALEVNQGWFSRHQIRVGDRVENLPRPLP
jgi:uncharacterized membrane protein (UPF0127 family)